MSYPINYPTPVNCDVKTFIGRQKTQSPANVSFVWNKPTGVSFIWFTLIGAGGYGSTGNGTYPGGGGGSGAVTNCLMPAFLVPDTLDIALTTSAVVRYKEKNSYYTLITASDGQNGGYNVGGTGGTASTSNFFTCAGLFQSVAGQNGTAGSWAGPSATTFLSGGYGSSVSATLTANYGYQTVSSNASPGVGFFQISPIIVGLGAVSNSFGKTSNGGIGCGGGGQDQNELTQYGFGGPPAVFIISW